MDGERPLLPATNLGYLDSGLMRNIWKSLKSRAHNLVLLTWYRIAHWFDQDYAPIVLSGGKPVLVKRLGLFELDNIKAEVLGPYSYSILTVTGQVIEDTYDLRALEEIPQKPADDNPAPGTAEWKQLQEYETYLAALAHERTRLESYEGYQADIAAYVLANCLEESDRRRVVEPDDWQRVYEAALVPQLTQEVIAQTLRDTFPGLVWQIGDTTGVSSSGAGAGDDQGVSSMGVTND